MPAPYRPEAPFVMLKPEMPTLAPPITWKTRLAWLASTPQAWPGTGITGIYSPATTLVGAIRGIGPSRNFEILHLSISGRPFTAQGTPAP